MACSQPHSPLFSDISSKSQTGIGDEDRSGAHQEGYSEQELIGGKFFLLTPGSTRANH
jgi:hypothetical protein